MDIARFSWDMENIWCVYLNSGDDSYVNHFEEVPQKLSENAETLIVESTDFFWTDLPEFDRNN